MLLGTVIWSVGYAGEIVWPDLAGKLWWARVQYLGIESTVIGWVVFCIHVAGFRPLARIHLAALSVEPAATILLSLASNRFPWLWRAVSLHEGAMTPLAITYGPYFWFHTGYSYLLLAVGAAVLVQASFRARLAHRTHIAAILGSVLVPSLGNLAYISRLGAAARFDLTPLSFLASGLFLAWGLFRLRILSTSIGLAPAARDVAVELMEDPVFVFDASNTIVDINQAACRLLGIRRPDRLIGQPCSALAELRPCLSALDNRDVVRAVVAVDGGPGEASNHTFELTVTELTWSPGACHGRLAVLHDITELAQTARQLKRQALHDSLTGLPNRNYLYDRLEELTGRDGGSMAQSSLLMVDINGFREVNDILGHEVGDRLLQQVANRLRDTLDSPHTVARVGGDEFGILLPGAQQLDAEVAAQRLLGELGRPYDVDGNPIRLRGRAGISILDPTNRLDSGTLMRHAVIAQGHAKRTNSRYSVYSGLMDTSSPERLRLLADLPAALEGGQISLHFQPQVDCATGLVVGAEALARWNHPQLGGVSPGVFVPLAEQSGLIDGLWDEVLRRALDQHKQWLRRGMHVPVAVNLSPHNLGHPAFISGIRRALAERSLAPECLEIELTETALMADQARSLRMLQEASDLGVIVTLDDFGTGYSSLALLATVPADIVKIDQAFIRGLRREGSSMVISRAIATLGHQLGLKVIAEGIEDELTMRLVREIECDYAQGYYIGRPQPPEAFMEWLARNRCRGAASLRA
jgi:diguanylate cyclase (GGDEF)-like protein